MRHKCCQDLNPQEAILADTQPTSTQRPLIVTIGALVVTGFVIAGMVFWPTTSDCMNAGGAFGSCLQQSLAERGLGSAPEPEAIVTAEPEIVTETESSPADSVEPEVAPSPVIDARVEADGSTILAGTVDPNIDVHLFFNGVEVGQTTSDSVGDWIYIPDEPLPMGGVAITLGTGVEGEEIAQIPEALAVVVDGENEPTVMAAAPDELADLIEELTGTPPELVAGDEAPMEMAAIDPEDTPEMNAPDTAAPDADLVAPAPDAATDAPVADEPVVDESLEEEAATDAPEANVPAAPEAATDEPVESATPDAMAEESEAADAPAEETPVNEPASDPAMTEDEPMQMAAVEPDQDTPDAPVTAVPPAISVEPTIDAVEIDPDGSFIAGAGEDGMRIRLFVDDEFVGESPVEGGRWLVETDEALTEPDQRIRAEMVAPGDLVTAEAEINFVIEQPERAGPAADADLILPADQLAPIALPTEAPMVIADTPAAEAEPVEAQQGQDLILPNDSLSEMMLPAEAPAVALAEPAPETPIVEETPASPEQEPSDMEIAEAQPETAFTLPDDQLAPIALPTEAPVVSAPEATADEPEASAIAAADEPLILSDDQLAPLALPTEAPPVTTPPEAKAPIEVADVPEDEIVLSEDQLAPVELPAEAPVVDSEAGSPQAVADVDPLIAPAEQLPELELPTDAPLVAEIPAAASEADSPQVVSDVDPLILPAEQLPEIELPTDAPLVGDALEVSSNNPDVPADAAQIEETPEMEIAESAPVTLPSDQLPALDLPTEAPMVETDEARETAEAPTPEPAPVRLPAEQLPEIALPTEAPPVELAEAEPDEDEIVETPPVDEGIAEVEVPTLIASPVGDPQDGRFASGKVIIRRGDNLWTIARRVYGRGIQYTTIFEANREKISNPDLIFPGQVFELPESASQ